MAAPRRLLEALRQEVLWTNEGSNQPSGPSVKFVPVSDWSQLPEPQNFSRPDHTAIRVDDRLLFGDELKQASRAGYWVEKDPNWIMVRTVDQNSGERKVIAFIRQRDVPSQDELDSIDHL